MRLKTLLAASCIGCVLATPALANLVTHTADTTADPTFNRPIEDLSVLSSTGTATHYDAYTFSVGSSGSYNVTVTGTYDTFAFLYSPGFTPGAPLTNAKFANDDLLGFATSGFTAPLVTGVNYTLVTTGFANSDRGIFSATIGGPGTITPSGTIAPPAASPNILTRTATTAGKPTFDRPIEDLSALSSLGTAVSYDTFHFKVGTTGTYTFVTNGLFDTFDFLYSGAFDPMKPLLNAIDANDDLLGIGTSGFTATLAAGVDYFFVTSGFDNSDVGLSALTIGGPGRIIDLTTVAAVPEPGVLALMLSGLVLVGGQRRRTAARR